MASKVARIKLGSQGLEVSKQGLGCMSMSWLYGGCLKPEEEIALIHHAVNDVGVTFLDTSDVYGPFHNEILIGKALKGIRHKVQLATKFGIFLDEDGKRGVCGHPSYVRSACEASLKRLDVDYIDLYYQHRVDTTVPIEVTVGEMKKLVEEGKVKYLGLSEASASTIRRAHAVHPITAVQIEWSLWSQDAEKEIIPTCRELGIGVVAYSPLGCGFFSIGAKIMQGDAKAILDFRKVFRPRFGAENLEKNERLFLQLHGLAERRGCTPGQLALAWVQHQGDDVVPIPGTTKLKNFEENVGALQVKFSKEEIEEIEALFHGDAVAGERLVAGRRSHDNSDTPPLSSWQDSQA